MKPKKRLWHKILFIISPLLIFASVKSLITYDYSSLSKLSTETILPTLIPLLLSAVIAYYFTTLFYLEIKEYYSKWKNKSDKNQ